jgi:hypothetical protein
MRPQADIDAGNADDRELDRIAKQGGAAFDFAHAIRTARKARADAGLDMTFDEQGIASFTDLQLHRSITHTREDTAATLMLQMMIMRRLDRNRNFMIGIVVLLLIVLAQI